MKKSVSIAIHFGLWLGIIFLLMPVGFFFTFDENIGDINNPVLNWIKSMVPFILPAMVSFYAMFLFTKIIIRKKWTLVFPIAIYVLFFFYLAYEARNGVEVKGLFLTRYLMFSVFIFSLLGSLFRFQLEWLQNKKEKYELEEQNSKSKMALLLSQINPHFLFNTLNNIDTLIYDNQDKASKSLLKLSYIMRYMLNDAKTDAIALEKEIKHLESYLALEQLRIKNDNFVKHTIKGDYTGIKIAPMIIIPFVENAFKHCVDSDIENGVTIEIAVLDNKFIFNCKNQFDKSEQDKDKGHGIGLATVKKRLNLIYKDKHELSITSDNSVFNVSLEIDLNEN